MRKATSVLLAGLSAGALGGCEDASTVECGPGTVLQLSTMSCLPADDSPRFTCGAGTRADGRECVPEDRSHFELRVLSPLISANALQPVPVVAHGTYADGTPVLEPAILSIDRPGAGNFLRTNVELDALGAVAHYRPCSVTRPGCTGPVRFSLALAAAPGTPVATLDAELVESPVGSSAAACLAADELMFLDGEDSVFTGTLSAADARWGVTGTASRLQLRVEPSGSNRSWQLEFNTLALGTPLEPGVYEHVRRPGTVPPSMPRAAMDVRSSTSGCGQVDGSFEVHAYEVVGDVVEHALISFEQRCTGAPRTLRGCVRVTP